MKLHLLQKMLLCILLPALLGLSAVTFGSYMKAKDSLNTQITEELKQTVLSETSQLKSVTTDLLRNILCNNARIAAVYEYLKSGPTALCWDIPMREAAARILGAGRIFRRPYRERTAS